MHGPRDLTRDRELDMTENFAAQQASLHEDHHWLQWIGTSIGLFLTAVRFSQEQTAGLLCELPPPLRRELRDQRIAAASSPIVFLGADGSLEARSERGNRMLGSLVQGWYDHLLTYRLFTDSDVVDGLSWDLVAGFTETMCDVESTFSLMGVTSGYDYHACQQHLQGLSDVGWRVSAMTGRVTTTSILEAAATVDEYLGAGVVAARFPDWGGALYTNLIDRLHTGDYGKALRLFGALVHDDDRAGLADAFTFGLACDIALNPPLPPLTTIAEMPTSWADLYPPVRFIRACQALKRLSIRLGPESSHDDDLALCEAICSVARIPLAEERVVSLDAYQRVDWASLLRADRAPEARTAGIPEDYAYLDFLLWCGARARELRGSDIRLMINPAHHLTAGNLDALKLRIEEHGAGWYQAPAVALGNYFGFADPIKSWFGTWLMTKTVSGAFVQDWMAGTSALDLSWLPAKLREEQSVWDSTLDRLLDL